MRKGMDPVAQAQERRDSAPKFDGPSLNFFAWKADETKTLRFLTDPTEVITAGVHEFIQTKNGKRNFICRKEFGADNCPLCDGFDSREGVRPRELAHGIAVLREAVVEEKGGKKTVTGIKDWTQTVEVEGEDGKTKSEVQPWVGIVQQGPTNFWIYLKALYERQGSWRDYDIDVQRHGEGMGTTYVPFSLPPVEIKNIDERYKRFVPNLEDFLNRQGSESYYDKHLGTNLSSEAQGPFAGSEDGDKTESLEGELDEESEFDRLRQKQEELTASESY